MRLKKYLLTVALGLTVAGPLWSDNHGRPNILLMLTDDQGWGDVGFHGNPDLKTPNLDRLATESTELTQFTACPNCSPTRQGS